MVEHGCTVCFHHDGRGGGGLQGAGMVVWSPGGKDRTGLGRCVVCMTEVELGWTSKCRVLDAPLMGCSNWDDLRASSTLVIVQSTTLAESAMHTYADQSGLVVQKLLLLQNTFSPQRRDSSDAIEPSLLRPFSPKMSI